MKSKFLKYTLLMLGLVGPPLCAHSGDDSILSPETAVDSDDGTNLNATFIPNDTAATAQAIRNPVVLTGYVNQPGSGAEGRSYEAGDLVDAYQVNLKAGDRSR